MISSLGSQSKSDSDYRSGSTEAWNRIWLTSAESNYLDPDSFIGVNERIKVDSFLGLFKQAPGRHSLECGCGLATVSMLLADWGFEVVMLDSSTEALLRVQATMAISSRAGTVLAGDINAIPAPDLAYDLVHSYGVLEHFEDIERPMAEMARVLRPGGIFFANIVPAKQGLIHTAAYHLNHATIFTGSVTRLRFKQWWKFLNQERQGKYFINWQPLSAYREVLRRCGIGNFSCGGYGLFPNLALPAALQRRYIRFIERHRQWGIRFNQSGSDLSRMLGFGWWVCGVKQQ